MFTFQRIMSGDNVWRDRLLFQNNHVGYIGFDEEGLFINLIENKLTLQDIHLLFSQVVKENPTLLNQKIELNTI